MPRISGFAHALQPHAASGGFDARAPRRIGVFGPSAGRQSGESELSLARGTLFSFEAEQRTAGLEKQETRQ
jgi:hypothetical protein